jgi:hypothetical protein
MHPVVNGFGVGETKCLEGLKGMSRLFVENGEAVAAIG